MAACAILASVPTIAHALDGSGAESFAEPNPPALDLEPARPAPEGALASGANATPSIEWRMHKTDDGVHPDANEQAMMWLMNIARSDPTDEGDFLANSTRPDISSGRSYFGVDTNLLQQEFAAILPAPPAAFDQRLYLAARAHSEALIDRDSQDHNGQLSFVHVYFGSGYSSLRLSVFSYARSALYSHAALNIDWGPGDGTGMQPGRGHRAAIMGAYDNVGLAMVPETDGGTHVGPLVFSGNYARVFPNAADDRYNRFLVGSVWDDDNDDGLFDPGEGYANVTVMPDHGDFYAVTSAGGGYAIPIESAGTYRVTFSGGGIGGQVVRDVSVQSVSVLLDVMPSTGVEPVPEPSPMLLTGVALAIVAALSRRRAESLG